MHRSWYRSRLFWLGISGCAFLIWAWVSPILSGKGRYFGARWIAPGNFYQGFGISEDFHRVELWAGRPYAGLFNISRRTGITHSSFPFESKRHSWAANESGPIKFEWGTPSADSFTISIDYWLIVPVYLAVWSAAVILWQRRKRRLNPHFDTPNQDAQQVTPSNGG
jgi:hypothetical protein